MGIAETADLEEIRHAYRALIRRHHPDHLGARAASPEAMAEAERRVRELNVAWQTLRDPERRRGYDRSLPHTVEPTKRPAYSAFPPGTEPEPPGGFDEWFAEAARPPRPPRVVERPAGPVKPFRVRLLIGAGVALLCGILLIVALTGSSDDGVRPGVGRGQCVRVDPGPHTVEVPCDGPNDGRVLDEVDVAGECPAGSDARRLFAADTGITCLGS